MARKKVSKWVKEVRRVPLNEVGLGRINALYEANWVKLIEAVKEGRGTVRKYQKREKLLNDKDVEIREKLGLIVKVDENGEGADCLGERTLLDYLHPAFNVEKSSSYPLTRVYSRDILCNEVEGE